MAADYVIVGAGSAGCVLAARLSEEPEARVLLLEAGGPDTAPEIRIPAAFPIMFKSGLDWDLLGEEEPGLDGRRLYLPRGRMIGGCSSINAMIYLRGNRADYDEWAAGGATGCVGTGVSVGGAGPRQPATATSSRTQSARRGRRAHLCTITPASRPGCRGARPPARPARGTRGSSR